MCHGHLWRDARGHVVDSTEGKLVCELGGAHRTENLAVDGGTLLLAFGWAAPLVQSFAASSSVWPPDRTTGMLATETAWHCLAEAVSAMAMTAVWAVIVVAACIRAVAIMAAGILTVVVVTGVRTMVVVAAGIQMVVVIAADVAQ